MFFHKFDFFIFFIITYFFYIIAPYRKLQITILLIASYIFYAMWDWRFLPLILLSTVVDYYCGSKIYYSKQENHKKHFLILSISINLFILFIFKYYNFFIDSLNILLHQIGISSSLPLLNLIVPLGLSFYTFQTMSYTIDIYKNDYKPIDGFINYAFYVTFFAQLLGGPIERARIFLPQVTSPRTITIDQIETGIMLFIVGLFKKTVISSRLVLVVNEVFNNIHQYTGFTLILASYAFVFYVYVDFSAYSNMARGLAKLMGFELTPNFCNPFISKNPSEFFARWHISLVNWFKEYLFFPMAIWLGSPVKSLFVTFVLVGLWHEGTWPWVIWGAYLGFVSYIYHLIYKLTLRYKVVIPPAFRFISNGLQIFFMLNVVLLTAFFIVRSNSVNDILYIVHNLFNFTAPLIQFDYTTFSEVDFNIAWITVVLMFIFQLFQQKQTIDNFYNKWHYSIKMIFLTTLLLGILLLSSNTAKHFIYFSL